jgi:uncharacterized protein (DUF4213/DUF364 family)
MEDPLRYFHKKFGFEPAKLEKVVIGEIYSAVKLTNGQIGVCSNLHETIEYPNFESFPDLSKISHRIIYNAYLNAHLNYSGNFFENSDIFNAVDFHQYRNIVMIGYFKPLVEKLEPIGIKLKLFDLFSDDERVYPVEKQSEIIPEADALIMSATTLSNNTFSGIISKISNTCDVFILGPSTPLSQDFFKYGNIKSVFGMQFDIHDDEILRVIGNGKGTRTFSKLGRKLVLKAN